MSVRPFVCLLISGLVSCSLPVRRPPLPPSRSLSHILSPPEPAEQVDKLDSLGAGQTDALRINWTEFSAGKEWLLLMLVVLTVSLSVCVCVRCSFYIPIELQ